VSPCAPTKAVFGIATAAGDGFGVTVEAVLAEAPPAKSVAVTPSAPTPVATFQDHLLVNDIGDDSLTRKR
jgi:hypothetical protein